ncbi:GYF domain-containing protein [Hydrotalea sp.]|uniref:GYF domain-containing protein n=1 Tax=Hydrotalea sp. TaxID=2881279 RepID=UPI00261E597D|nr:GYF domain-containing protein [Hydrotalea sp.]
MEKIYILRKGKLIIGPFNLNKIAKRGLKISDKVWYEGLEDWTPVEELSHLVPCIITNNNSDNSSFFEKVFSFLK